MRLKALRVPAVLPVWSVFIMLDMLRPWRTWETVPRIVSTRALSVLWGNSNLTI